MRVAFLGLGIMGRPMAANLVKAGHEVAAWNRAAGKEAPGARTAATPREAAEGDTKHVWRKLLFQSGKSLLAGNNVSLFDREEFRVRTEDLETSLQFCSKDIEQI